MRYGKIGYYDDFFGLDVSYVNYGGYADPAMSLVSAPVPGSGQSPPIPFFGYSFPVLEQRHHYDVSYYTGNYYQNGEYSSGDYSFSNFSIDTIDQYSWFGHTSMYHISSSSGYGSWFSAPGYNVSSGHYQSSEVAGMHSDTWFGSSDSFVFRDVASDFLHIQSGAFVLDNSHLEMHEGAGVHVNTVFESLDGFTFRDTVIDSSHLQLGSNSFDSFHSVVRADASTQYMNLFGGYGARHESSLEIHDQQSQQGPGFYANHTSDYSEHSSDNLSIGMPPFMMATVHLDDMSLMLGHGMKG